MNSIQFYKYCALEEAKDLLVRHINSNIQGILSKIEGTAHLHSLRYIPEVDLLLVMMLAKVPSNKALRNYNRMSEVVGSNIFSIPGMVSHSLQGDERCRFSIPLSYHRSIYIWEGGEALSKMPGVYCLDYIFPLSGISNMTAFLAISLNNLEEMFE